MKKLAATILLVLAALTANAQRPDNSYVETWLQYVPAVTQVGLGLAGVEAENGIGGRVLELGYTCVAEVLLVNALLKNVVHEERPDGSAFNSFPSGHSATAFAGAELVRLEYGWGWGAGAYALAAGVAVGRVVHQRHWWWDTVAGAGCGILCANIGHALVQPTFRLLGVGKRAEDMSLVPCVDPVSGTLCAQFAMRF